MTAIIVLAAAGVGLLLYTWSGAYNIAATRPHWGATLYFINLLKDRSIAVHSGKIQSFELEDVQKGAAFAHFHGMCRLCHGAPGTPSLEFAGGFYPSPPSLISGHLQQARSEAEIYWIVKHGIKMTGMPAFGPTHEEKALWGLAALVKEISRMTPEEYRRKVEAASTETGAGHGHTGGHRTLLHSLARHPGAVSHGRGAGRELRGHKAGRDLPVPLPGETGRNILVPQPFPLSGADRGVRPFDYRPRSIWPT
jgi:hypothetical protein